MAKKDQNFEDTRAMIRETAAGLFTTGGVHASSLGDIAKAANLSKGTLYYYYPSKEYLVADITEAHLGRMTDLIFSWIDTLYLEKAAADCVRELLDLLLSDTDALRLHFVLQCEALREETGALLRRFSAKAREWTVMLEVGSLKMSGPGADRFRSLSKHFFALLDGFALHLLMGEEPEREKLLAILTGEG